jgi:hypothetical protein
MYLDAIIYKVHGRPYTYMGRPGTLWRISQGGGGAGSRCRRRQRMALRLPSPAGQSAAHYITALPHPCSQLRRSHSSVTTALVSGVGVDCTDGRRYSWRRRRSARSTWSCTAAGRGRRSTPCTRTAPRSAWRVSLFMHSILDACTVWRSQWIGRVIFCVG